VEKDKFKVVTHGLENMCKKLEDLNGLGNTHVSDEEKAVQN
jgi:hypothetical protein